MNLHSELIPCTLVCPSVLLLFTIRADLYGTLAFSLPVPCLCVAVSKGKGRDPDSSGPRVVQGGKMLMGTELAQHPHRGLQVLLADDHAIVRDGLKAILKEENIEVVGE